MYAFISFKLYVCIYLFQALFPTTLNRIGWGYGDFSLRYFSADDKVHVINM